MDELIEEIINIVATTVEDNYLRKYDLKRAIENYTEREIDRRVDMYIEEEKSEAWSSGYGAGKRDVIAAMKDNFDEMLYNL